MTKCKDCSAQYVSRDKTVRCVACRARRKKLYAAKPGYRVCRSCYYELPLTDYYLSKGIRQYSCKTCSNENAKRNHRANRVDPTKQHIKDVIRAARQRSK